MLACTQKSTSVYAYLQIHCRLRLHLHLQETQFQLEWHPPVALIEQDQLAARLSGHTGHFRHLENNGYKYSETSITVEPLLTVSLLIPPLH